MGFEYMIRCTEEDSYIIAPLLDVGDVVSPEYRFARELTRVHDHADAMGPLLQASDGQRAPCNERLLATAGAPRGGQRAAWQFAGHEPWRWQRCAKAFSISTAAMVMGAREVIDWRIAPAAAEPRWAGGRLAHPQLQAISTLADRRSGAMERWEHADVDLELRLLGEWKVWLGPALRGAGGVGARGRGGRARRDE